MVTTDVSAATATTAGASQAAAREQLRRLIRSIEARPPVASPVALRDESVAATAERRPLEQTLPGEWIRHDDGVLIATRYYPLAHLHGQQPLDALRAANGAMLALLGRDPGLARRTMRDLLFLDIETTGLGGAGAMVFLVTTGRIEPRLGDLLADAPAEEFVLRQYLAPSPAEEGALLARLVADCIGAPRPLLATYNGRGFDAPMLDQRATMHRMRAGFEALDHLDLLATVRRGFRGLLPSCRLAEVEVATLGVTRPSDEVAGAEVPAWYFRFLRTGDVRWLAPLIAHNAYDVLSLAALMGRLAATLGAAEGAVAATAAPTAVERLAAARLHLGALERDEGAARAHLDAAADGLPGGWMRDEALLTLARLHRRAGRRDQAAALWAEVAHRPGAARALPLTELAKHHEHLQRDPAAALELVERAIDAAGETPDLLHRRSRLQRKVARSS